MNQMNQTGQNISREIWLQPAYWLCRPFHCYSYLAQHNQVTAVDIIPEKVKQINNKKSPIQDDYIENI